MASIEEERRKAKMSLEDYIRVQQPFDKKNKKVNPLFIKAFGKDKLPKEKKKYNALQKT
jgi:hypothetical protein